MTNEKRELQQRYEAKKKELESKVADLKADFTRSANDAAAQSEEQVALAQERLREVEQMTKDGFDQLTNEAASRVNDLLDRIEKRMS